MNLQTRKSQHDVTGHPAGHATSNRLAVVASLFLAAVVTTHAGLITGTLTGSGYGDVNISAGTGDFAYYGNAGNVMDVKAGGPNSFSNLTGKNAAGDIVTGNYFNGTSWQLFPMITYTGGTPTASRSWAEGYRYFDGNKNSTVSFTHTLFQSSEVVTIYMAAFSYDSYTCNLDATLSDGTTYSYGSTALPNHPSYDDALHYGGIWALTVSGQAGDTLTVKITTTSGDNYSNIGIGAVSATPEPASLALLGLGGLALLRRRRA